MIKSIVSRFFEELFDLNSFILSPIFEPHKSNPYYYPTLIFDAEPPEVDVPVLQELAANALDDQQIIERVTAYFFQNIALLQSTWQESSLDRLKAFLSMYIIHTSHPYGDNKTPYSTFMQYLHRSNSDCSLYALYQSRLLDAFGLQWRHVAISSGTHGWIEVEIDGQWEIFDSTVNVWINRSSFDLCTGIARAYRFFYTPWSDINRPEARQVIFDEGLLKKENKPVYSVGALRSNMPGLGIYFFTNSYQKRTGYKLEIWGASGS